MKKETRERAQHLLTHLLCKGEDTSVRLHEQDVDFVGFTDDGMTRDIFVTLRIRVRPADEYAPGRRSVARSAPLHR